MDAVTYPDKRVDSVLDGNVVPLKLEVAKEPGLAQKLGVRWTPGLLWIDKAERVQHRNTGFFEPVQFCAEIVYGCGHVAAAEGDWSRAKTLFERVGEQFPK